MFQILSLCHVHSDSQVTDGRCQLNVVCACCRPPQSVLGKMNEIAKHKAAIEDADTQNKVRPAASCPLSLHSTPRVCARAPVDWAPFEPSCSPTHSHWSLTVMLF